MPHFKHLSNHDYTCIFASHFTGLLSDIKQKMPISVKWYQLLHRFTQITKIHYLTFKSSKKTIEGPSRLLSIKEIVLMKTVLKWCGQIIAKMIRCVFSFNSWGVLTLSIVSLHTEVTKALFEGCFNLGRWEMTVNNFSSGHVSAAAFQGLTPTTREHHMVTNVHLSGQPDVCIEITAFGLADKTMRRSEKDNG